MIRWDDTFTEQVAAMSDADLLAAYQETTGEPGNAGDEALLTEIERRGLDV